MSVLIQTECIMQRACVKFAISRKEEHIKRINVFTLTNLPMRRVYVKLAINTSTAGKIKSRN